MSEQEREIRPPESAPESWSLEDAPKPEEGLSERLAEAAESLTAELKDLHESLVPAEPVVEVPGEPVTEFAEQPIVEVAHEPIEELPEPVVEVAHEPVVEAPVGPAPEPLPELPVGKPKEAPTPSAAAGLESTNDDRLVSALAWLTMVILQLPIVSIIQLLSSTNKERPFQRHHAVTSLLFYAAAVVYEIVAGIAYVVLGLVTLGIGFACLWVIFFVPHLLGLYYALQAYNGKRVELPILSDFGRNQGWM